MKKLIIFDMDGLILDTERIHDWSWQEAFREMELDIPEHDRHSLMGLGPSNYMKQIRKVIDNDSIVDEVRQRQREAYHGYFAENNPDIMEGALNLLEALRKMDVKIALATSTRKESATRSLNKVGLFEKFDYLVFGDMVSNSKPNPEIYNKVIEDLGILKKDAVILEDSYHGIKAANNAEIDVIWVKDFIDHSDKKDIHYSRMFDSLAEAHQYVVDLVQK